VRKKHDAHKKKPIVISKNASRSPNAAAAGAFPDGRPFDRIQYLQAKLILKPERFTSIESFRDFGKLVQKSAKKANVRFVVDPKASRRPEIREIVFVDTPDFRLYNNAFILRRRISYEDGFPVGDPEIVFKFRHTDEHAATTVDVRPKIAGKYRIKFKAEVLPLKDRIGGYRVLYSHNCQFGLSQARGESDTTSMATLARVFPALAVLKKKNEERVTLVNQEIVEEVLLPLGDLHFGKKQAANCDIALWRTRGEHTPLVGEFAFQVKFPSQENVAEKSKMRAALFFITLQKQVKDWLMPGVTKTGVVYQLKGNKPVSHE
jgi:hypothetical protein